MAYFRIPSGSNLVLNVLLGDGAADKYTLAYVYQDNFSQVLGSPFPLAHVSQGLYSNLGVSVPDGRYIVVYVVYDDSLYSIPSPRYGRSTDTFDVNDIVDINAIFQGVWRGLMTGNTPAGSFGEAMLNCLNAAALAADTKANTDTLTSRLTAGRATNLDNLNATVSSRSTPASGASAVWNDIKASYTAPGTFGSHLDAAITSRESEASAASRDVNNNTKHDASLAAISSVKSDSTGIKAKTDQLLFTSGLVHSRAEAVIDKTGYALSPAGVDTISSAVWDEQLVDHFIPGSTGEGLTDASTDVTGLANAVWNKARSANNSSGSFGEALQGVLSPARASNLDNLDTTITSRESEASASSRASADAAQNLALQNLINALDTKVGVPPTSLSAEIALIKGHTSKIGTPATATVSTDIASLKNDVAIVNSGLSSLTVSSANSASNVSAIKAKTDQLNFTGINVNANVQVMGDKTGYALSGATVAQVAAAVWDRVAASHSTAGTTGKVLQDAAIAADMNTFVDGVWNALHTGYTTAGSFAVLLKKIDLDTNLTNGALIDPTNGLQAIRTTVINEAGTQNATLATHTAKLDAIPVAISSSQGVIVSEINVNEAKIDLIVPAITTAKNQVISEVNANEVKIDALQTSVGSLSNNTTVRFIVPERIIKPTVGTKDYQFHLRLFDDLGNPEAPDSAPLIRIRRLDTGTDVVLSQAMSQDGTKVGAYFFTYTVGISNFVSPILVEATVVENGITRYIPATSEVTEFETDLTALSMQVSQVDTKVSTTQLTLNNPSTGLAALAAGQTSILSNVAALDTKATGIKAKTDLITNDIAKQSDTDGILAVLTTKPNIADITTVVNLARDSVKGSGNRDITQAYNQFDISSVAKTNDPRFNNLDVAVSSRSTLTASAVWAAASRSLTQGNPLTYADVKAVWDFLASNATASGSLGKRIADNLNATVSSRATTNEVVGPLAGVAQEATVSAMLSSLTNDLNQNEVLIQDNIAKTDAVLAKTNNLPSDPASASALSIPLTAINSKVSDVDLRTTQIKAKTDALPPDPAKESSVLARPVNPLLATDLRLNTLSNLDAPISSIMPPDISGLAEKTDVTASASSVSNLVNLCRDEVALVKVDSAAIKAKTDALPSSPSSTLDVINARNAVIARIDADGIPLTASAVWSHGSRTITQDPATFGPDISGLAEKTDLASLAEDQYAVRMSTVFNKVTGAQEVIVWGEKNGRSIASTSASVVVKDSLGVTRWSATSTTPNSDNVFRFENVFSAPSSQNYYIVLTAMIDELPRTSIQSFYTVV